MQEIFLEEIAIHDIVTRLGDEITRDFQGEEVYAVCILKGAALFFSDLVRAIKLPVQLDFMQLSSYGSGSASSGQVKILLDLASSVEGKNVIIVEDIVDTGLSMHYLMENFRHRRAKSVRLCSLLSKPSRRKVDVRVDYCGIEAPDAFLVGYGLDYAQKYRNLPYIGVLKPEIYAKN
ncbi:hypoxanthine phosphoribosyltransferase [Selenomonas sp. TAMA-11512]|uniref:hypoxanthine phosphoribosyltransferase n=1 Tax=Selenomonas sp. TAMA-11512 TaxID=3095337 RepID=UPI0030CB3458